MEEEEKILRQVRYGVEAREIWRCLLFLNHSPLILTSILWLLWTSIEACLWVQELSTSCKKFHCGIMFKFRQDNHVQVPKKFQTGSCFIVASCPHPARNFRQDNHVQVPKKIDQMKLPLQLYFKQSSDNLARTPLADIVCFCPLCIVVNLTVLKCV